MNNAAKSIVEEMFAAFGKGDMEGFLKTVSADTVWIYHGTQIIPQATYKGFEGVRSFVSGILDYADMISFEPLEYIVEGNKVVVLGQEHQRVKKTSQKQQQKWVQVYTIKNGLIARMEEFATSEILTK